MFHDRLINACRGLPVDVTPVWFVGDGGRYLPDYKRLREKYTLHDMYNVPELCVQLTVSPVKLFGADGAVIMSDAGVLLEAMDAPVKRPGDTRLTVNRPLKSATDINNLRTINPEEDLPRLLESIDIAARELAVPLIGFSVAPFTLATLLIEGESNVIPEKTRKLMQTDETLWHTLMERLTDSVIQLLRGQVKAGASALYVADDQSGYLTTNTYKRFVNLHMKRLFVNLSDLNVPVIRFSAFAHHLFRQMREEGGHVFCIDSRMDIGDAWKDIGFDHSVQGNLDPSLLLGSWEGVRDAAAHILDRVKAIDQPGYIFSTGHNLLPSTPVDHIKRLVDFVHDPGTKQPVSTPRAIPARFPNPIPPTKDAVFLMAYGSPASRTDIGPYYTLIRGNRPPRPEMVAALTERYQMIGGMSPLTPTTLSLAHKLENRLNMPVYVGMRHAEPFVTDTLRQMTEDGIERAVAITLAPHYSKMSIGAYVKAAQSGLEHLEKEGRALHLDFIESWATHPLFIQMMADRLRRAATLVSGYDPESNRDVATLTLPEHTAIVFTAHSLPVSIRKWDDPYEKELENSCQTIADYLHVDDWHLAYQSEGNTPDPWLGPDITDFIPSLASKGVTSIIVCPFGFVADHLEIYYDIDIEAQTVARNEGVQLIRTESFNDDPDFVTLLARLVSETN